MGNLRPIPAGFELSPRTVRDLAELVGVPLSTDGFTKMRDADRGLRDITRSRAGELHGFALEAIHSVGSLLFWAQARDEPLKWSEIGDGAAYAVQLLADLAMVADDVRNAVEMADEYHPLPPPEE